MLVDVTCGNRECRYDNKCKAISLDADGVCITSRRRDRDARELMCQTNPMCRKTGQGYKSDHSRVIK